MRDSIQAARQKTVLLSRFKLDALPAAVILTADLKNLFVGYF